MARSSYFKGSLYQRMADDLHLAGMSMRTHDGYLRAVRQLADFCQAPPEKISEDQLRRFFLHLKNERHFAYGSLRVAFSGVKFFYTRTCKRAWQTLAQTKLQNVKSLPEVITIAQVHQIIDACRVGRIAIPRCSFPLTGGTTTVHPRPKDRCRRAAEEEALPNRAPPDQPGFLNKGLELRLVPREVKALMVR